MKKTSKRATLAVAALMAGSVFCSSAFARESPPPPTPELTAISGSVTVLHAGTGLSDNNEINATGAAVTVPSFSHSVSHNSATSGTVNVSWSGMNNNVTALGAVVDLSGMYDPNPRDKNTDLIPNMRNSGHFNSAESTLVEVTSTGSGSFIDPNSVSGIGALVQADPEAHGPNYLEGNKAISGSVSVTNTGDWGNEISGIGAYVNLSGYSENNLAKSGSVSVVNNNDGQIWKKDNVVSAMGAFITGKDMENNKALSTTVSVVNDNASWGRTTINGGNEILVIGALVTDGEKNVAASGYTWSASRDPLGTLTPPSTGVYVNNSGSYNTINATGAYVSGGFMNVAVSGTVSVTALGSGNTINATGAVVSAPKPPSR